jgi:hypothetical protein
MERKNVVTSDSEEEQKTVPIDFDTIVKKRGRNFLLMIFPKPQSQS